MLDIGVDGTDSVFIGSADLAADMDHLGQPGASEVQEVANNAIAWIRAAGRAAGILTSDRSPARGYAEAGVLLLAVGSVVGFLLADLSSLRSAF